MRIPRGFFQSAEGLSMLEALERKETSVREVARRLSERLGFSVPESKVHKALFCRRHKNGAEGKKQYRPRTEGSPSRIIQLLEEFAGEAGSIVIRDLREKVEQRDAEIRRLTKIIEEKDQEIAQLSSDYNSAQHRLTSRWLKEAGVQHGD